MIRSGLLVRRIPGPSAPAVADLSGSLGPHGFIFASGEGEAHLSRWSYAGLEPAHISHSVQDALRELSDWETHDLAPAPFSGGAVGYLAYDEGWRWAARSRKPRTDPCGIPGVHLALFDAVYARDEQTGEGWLIAQNREDSKGRLEQLEQALSSAPAPAPGGLSGTLRPEETRTAYEAKVQEILRLIRDGEVYQVNLSHTLSAKYEGDWRSAVLRMAQNPPPFGAGIGLGSGRAIISASPECFLDFDATARALSTYPIKGTRARSASAEEDAELARELKSNIKERAEHLMIVDLLRNDLGRIATAGTVKVERLAYLESFTSVHHITSRIDARVIDGLGIEQILQATFPGGSITGAPKLRAMEIIDRLEQRARGVYTGIIGYLSPGGSARFSIAIRTATLVDEQIRFAVGGGIVADSTAEAEWQETLTKTQRLASLLRAP